MADVVAVKYHGMDAAFVQCLLNKVGQGRLSGSRQPGKPHNARHLMFELGARGFIDKMALPMNVVCPVQPESDEASAGRLVGEAVDKNEGASPPVICVSIECNWGRSR